MTEQEAFKAVCDRRYLDPRTAKEAWDAALEWAKQGQEPVAWRHNLTHWLSETEDNVELADGDEWAVPLFLHPAPAQPVGLSISEKLLAIQSAEIKTLPSTINRHHALVVSDSIIDAMLAKGAAQAVVAENATSQTQPAMVQQLIEALQYIHGLALAQELRDFPTIVEVTQKALTAWEANK